MPGSSQQLLRRWVSQLRQGFDVLMDLSHVPAYLQHELDVAMDRGLAAASVEELEALLLCVRWGGQRGAQPLALRSVAGAVADEAPGVAAV